MSKEIKWQYSRATKIHFSDRSEPFHKFFTIIKSQYFGVSFQLRAGKTHIGHFRKLKSAKACAELIKNG